MPDINLIHDTGVGDQNGNDPGKQKRKTPRQYSYTNPGKQSPVSEPSAPKFSFSRFFGRLRSGRSSSSAPKMPPSQKPAGRILHEEKIIAARPPAPRSPVPLPRPPSPQFTAPRFPQAKRTPRTGGSQRTPPERNVPGVNLVPEDLIVNTAGQNRLVMLGLFVLMTVLAVAATFLLLSLYLSRMKTEAQANTKDIQSMQSELQTMQATQKSAQSLHAMTLQVQQLLGTHIYWTKFLTGLEHNTVDTVYYRGLTADRAGRLTLLATGKDFRSVSRQLVAFQQATDFVKDVAISSASMRADGSSQVVDFTATITLADSVFYRDASGTPDFSKTQQ